MRTAEIRPLPDGGCIIRADRGVVATWKQGDIEGSIDTKKSSLVKETMGLFVLRGDQ